LDVSLFERLIKNGCAHVTLEQQRRMHPKVSRLMKPLYPNLRDHASVSEYPEIMGVDARVFFLTHGHLEDAEDAAGHSKENSYEANFIGALCAHLVKSGYEESQITVLSPYLGQVRVLKQRMRRDISTTNVHITAVDNFQGEENDIIVISLVRSNKTKTMGFLSVENRINVALTRARHGMFIVGNSDMLKGHKLWTSIVDTLQSDGCFSDRMPLIESETGCVVQVKSAEEIQCLLLDGDGAGDDEGDSPTQKAGGSLADRFGDFFNTKPSTSGKGKSRGRGRGDDGGGEGPAKKKSSQKSAAKKNDGRLPPGAPDPRAPVGSNGSSDRKATNGNDDTEASGAAEDADQDGEDGVKPKAKSGKKQKQKGANQVLFRCG
jgi:hypothetical protein